MFRIDISTNGKTLKWHYLKSIRIQTCAEFVIVILDKRTIKKDHKAHKNSQKLIYRHKLMKQKMQKTLIKLFYIRINFIQLSLNKAFLI